MVWYLNLDQKIQRPVEILLILKGNHVKSFSFYKFVSQINLANGSTIKTKQFLKALKYKFSTQ